jgi:hypothetical protein
MRSLTYAAVLLATGLAFAQPTPVSSSLSTDRVGVGEKFYITVNAQGSDVSQPDMVSGLKDTGIQVGQPSVEARTEIANVNGRISTVASKSWRYPARATKEGTISIPRIPIAVDGLALFTLPMQIRVTPSTVSGAQGNAPNGNGTELTLEQLAFLESSVDKPSPYQGEAVTLSLRIYAASDYTVQIVGPRTMPIPDRQGFYSGPQQQTNRMETRNAINYRVMEITIVMYPTVSGPLTIQQWGWSGEVNWRDRQFMQPHAVARDFLAPAIPINVQPLPDRPADFSGAVGKYSVRGALTTDKLVQGVPVAWTVTVSGQGNPDAIGAPNIPAMAWAHISGPEIEVQQQQNSLEATKTFRYTLTPLERGEQVLPAIKFVYFAPIIKNYKTEATPEVKLSIAASPDAAALVTAGGSRDDARSSVEVLNEGLLPIMDRPAVPFSPSSATMSLAWTETLAGLVVPPVLYGAFLLYLRHRRRLTGDVRYARRHFALSRFRENMRKVSGNDPGEALYRALAGYLSDMYNTVEAGLTSQETQEMLVQKGVSLEVVNAVVSVLRACERARYSGEELGPEELESLVASAELAVKQIQPRKRKGDRA